MTRKEQFVRDLQQNTTLLGRTVDWYRSLLKQFFSEGYAAGGTDPLTQGDLDEMAVGLILADVVAGITLSEQVLNFNDNAPVAQADYADTIARLRTSLS
jgi:hypothetical protein